MIVEQWFSEKNNKNYFSSNKDRMTCYGLWLFTNWMRRNHKKILKTFLEKEGFQAEIKLTLWSLSMIYDISIEMSSVREINIKSRAYYILDDLINIKNIDPDKIKIDEKSHKNNVIYYIGYVTPNRVKPLYFKINKVNGYIAEHDENKYLTLLHFHKDKNALCLDYGIWSTMEENQRSH